MENKEKNYRHYTMRLTTLAPVFIGDGRQLKKKEYILKDDGKDIIVMIPDIKKLYRILKARKKEQAFSEFLQDPAQGNLRLWLQNVAGIVIQPKGMNFVPYQFEIAKSSGAGSQRNNKKRGPENELMDIATFIKDPFGQPYIPGSSIKGMIRTALLAYELSQKQEDSEVRKRLEEIAETMEGSSDKKQYLKQLKAQAAKLEALIFHTLEKKKDKAEDALNSVMKGLIIGDSEPVHPSNLMLAQKLDWTIGDKEPKGINIYREALKPSVTLKFDISLAQEFPYSIEEIFEALEGFNQMSNQYFYQKFNRANLEKGTVYLGGGVGFLSKTVIYPAYQKEGVRLVDQLFRNTLGKNYDVHKHSRDKAQGVSPHACKCTRYQGKIYNMGICKLEQLT